MPYDEKKPIEACTICGGQANILKQDFGIGTVVDCSHCGDFKIDHTVARDKGLPIGIEVKRALARHLIRQMNGLPPLPWPYRADITRDFFEAVAKRNLPPPSELTDNLISYLAFVCENRPGKQIAIKLGDAQLIASIGAADSGDVSWAFGNLIALGYYSGQLTGGLAYGNLTGQGWEHIAALQQSSVSSQYAFFARKFDNPDLDTVFNTCLVPAVLATGFELRTVTQRAGLVDAIIEDEIRRCAFLIADLSDDNAGAYWEAGFAEGLGKPVIYICKASLRRCCSL